MDLFGNPPSDHKPYFREDHFSGGRPAFDLNPELLKGKTQIVIEGKDARARVQEVLIRALNHDQPIRKEGGRF